MSKRTKHIKNILTVVLLLLLAAGGSFIVEHSQVQGGTETKGRIVAKHRKPHGGGLYGDSYEIIIEYQAHGQRKHLITSRAVWDRFGTLNAIGAVVSVWYLDDGKAFINHFNYLHPITTTLIGLAVIGGLSALFALFVIPQSRYETYSSRVRQYQEAKNISHQRLSANRRLLLSRLHSLLLMVAAAIGLVVIGVLRSSAPLLITAFGIIILWLLAIKRMLLCPHCGASLVEDLKEIEPRIATNKTNWLIVRDYLAKGVPVTCRSCGRSLDD